MTHVMRPVAPGRAVLMTVLLAAGLGACHRFKPGSYTSPAVLYTAAMREFRHGRFANAQAAFEKLTFDLPARDTLVVRARYYLAECRYGLGDYVAAARDFRRVADGDPNDALAPDALLRAGDAHAELWRRPETDPSSGHTALATYQELTGRYPESPAAAVAVARVRALHEQFARKDFETGVFYARRNAHDSAILYFRGLIAQYPSTSLVPEAFVRLVRSYRAIGYREEEAETCDHLRQYYGTRADVRELCGDGTAGR